MSMRMLRAVEALLIHLFEVFERRIVLLGLGTACLGGGVEETRSAVRFRFESRLEKID